MPQVKLVAFFNQFSVKTRNDPLKRISHLINYNCNPFIILIHIPSKFTATYTHIYSVIYTYLSLKQFKFLPVIHTLM